MTNRQASTDVPCSWTSGYFLLEPLGWTRQPLSCVVALDPDLLAHLIRIDRQRMHLVALGLAHARREVTPALAWLLLERSRKEITEVIFGYQATGLGRVLRHLPDRVLAANTYRKLIELLNDDVTATFLHHSASISEATLIALHKLPPMLRRPAIITTLDRVDGPTGVIPGLRLLAVRAGVPFDRVATEVGALDQPQQLAAKIRSLVDALPLPETVPPGKSEHFGGSIAQLNSERLAKPGETVWPSAWPAFNDGTFAIYLSDEWQVACLLRRHGRLGWLLAQAKGPGNCDIDPDRLTEIQAAFDDVGAYPAADAETIRSILLSPDWVPRRGAGAMEYHEGLF